MQHFSKKKPIYETLTILIEQNELRKVFIVIQKCLPRVRLELTAFRL